MYKNAILALASMAILVFSSQAVQPSYFNGTYVGIVPAPGQPSISVYGNATAPFNTANMTSAKLMSNLYNLHSASGGVMLNYDSAQGLVISANMSGITHSYSGYDTGYPEVLYASKPWYGLYAPQSSSLALPIPLNSLPQITSIVNYTAATPNSLTPFDYSYDIYLTRDYKPSSVGPGNELEVMVWLDRNAAVPAGTLNRTITLPTLLNGTVKDEAWQVWVYGSGSDISFMLQNAVAAGQVGMPLTSILEYINSNMSTSWLNGSLNNYYLNDIELGMEFGSPSSSAADVNVEMQRYYYMVQPYASKPAVQASTSTPSTTAQQPASPSPTSVTPAQAQPGPGAWWYAAAIVAVLAVTAAALLLRRRRGAQRIQTA